MAILDAVPGLDVSVYVDGHALKEYDDEEEDEITPSTAAEEFQASRTVSKYVEAVSDKVFSVRLAFTKPFSMDCDAMSIPIFVDGKQMDTRVISKYFHKDNFRDRVLKNHMELEFKGVDVPAPGKNNQNFVKKFRFSKIGITMDDDKLKEVKQDSERIEKVGEITVKFYRADASPEVQKDSKVARDPSSELSQSSVHEKALKGQAKSHQVSFGPADELISRLIVKADKIDNFPIATFRFKYRSKEALKSLLIVERTPSPEPEEASASPPPVDLNNLDADQKKQLEKFLKGLIRNRGRGSSNTPQRTIKRERDAGEGPSNSKKKRKSGRKATVDLTEDSD
ncbi:hypothetical protein BDZ45DRAFT_744153 [Acephala macrosclerotiorum]|nr:hypothetical protein BDZ45DRAFT_744153 [Acephala macrosclerotiorum]